MGGGGWMLCEGETADLNENDDECMAISMMMVFIIWGQGEERNWNWRSSDVFEWVEGDFLKLGSKFEL